MGLIVDVSVALAWNVVSQANALTMRAAAIVEAEGGEVPFHFHVEHANALAMLMRRGRLTRPLADRAIANMLLADLDVDQGDTRVVYSEALPLADQYRLSVYDALYLELALRTGLPLATRDTALAAAAAAAGATLLTA